MLRQQDHHDNSGLTRTAILEALDKFVHSPPGYSASMFAHKSDYNKCVQIVARDLRDAKELLAFLRITPAIRLDWLLKACREETDNRMRIVLNYAENKAEVEYNAYGDYSTEYRNAVCRVLAGSIVLFWKELFDGITPESIRKVAQDEFGISIAKRWF